MYFNCGSFVPNLIKERKRLQHDTDLSGMRNGLLVCRSVSAADTCVFGKIGAVGQFELRASRYAAENCRYRLYFTNRLINMRRHRKQSAGKNITDPVCDHCALDRCANIGGNAADDGIVAGGRMRRIYLFLITIMLLAVPVQATEFTAPPAPREAQRYLPDETQDLGEGIWFVVRNVTADLRPSFSEAIRTCVSLISISLLAALLASVSLDHSSGLRISGTAVVALILIQPTNSMIQLGLRTVKTISEYGKLLLPVMTSALAAQGAVTKSGTLYTASVFINTLMTTAVEQLLVPIVYILLCICIGCKFFEHGLLQNMRSFIKWLVTWGLKTVLYVFTGYISISGIISGTADAAMLKATKLAISGSVPVVGNILSDASEAVLISAGLMKNAAGIYGVITMIALGLGPFLQVGVQYLLLNVTSGICHMFGIKEMAALIKEISEVMGLVLAMIGTVCVIMLISTVCFMKGMA